MSRASTSRRTLLALCVALALIGAWLANRHAFEDSSTTFTKAESRADSSVIEPALPVTESEISRRTSVEAGAAPSQVEPQRVRATGRIFGAVVNAAGEPRKDAKWIYARLNDERHRTTNLDLKGKGTFDFPALEFGTYWISASAHDCRVQEIQVELSEAAPVWHEDIALQDSPRIVVHVRTPDGRSIFDLPELDSVPSEARHIVPVATLEPPGEHFIGVVGSLNNKFGVGHFWDFGFLKDLPPGAMGVLLLDCDPPVHVSLMQYQCVLRSKRVEVGEKEVTFVITPAELAGKLATVQMRVTDADTRLPIAGARAELLSSSYEYGSGGTTDASGSVVFSNRQSGEFQIVLRAEGYEISARTFEVPPGGVTDIGEIALARGLSLRGRVLDPEGVPCSARFVLGVVDSANGSTTWLPRDASVSAADGSFALDGLGPHEYALRTNNFDGGSQAEPPGSGPLVSGNIHIDMRVRGPKELEIRLQRASRILLSHPRGAIESLKFSVADASDVEVVRGTFHELVPRRLLLPPDRYRITLLDATGGLVVEKSVTLGKDGILLDLGP